MIVRSKLTVILYKFDILLKKELKSGGVMVVTYSNLLENPDAFGAVIKIKQK